MRRGRSLAIIGSALLLPNCARRVPADAVRIGSTLSDENTTVAELYAAAHEKQGIPVDRRLRLGDEVELARALLRGELDIFPNADARLLDGRENDIVRLNASPANDSACLLTSQYAAEQYWLLRLTKCAVIAPKLRLAATHEFLRAGGPLERLQRFYHGFHFKDIIPCEDGTQFYLLNRGDAEVANGTTTDGNIAQTQLIVLADDNRFWPERHVAPAVRAAVLRAHPRIAPSLNRLSSKLTLYALQQLNTRRNVLGMDAHEAAEEFVTSHLTAP